MKSIYLGVYKTVTKFGWTLGSLAHCNVYFQRRDTGAARCCLHSHSWGVDGRRRLGVGRNGRAGGLPWPACR